MKRPSIVLQNVDGSHCRYITVRERDELRFSKPPQVMKPPRLKGKKKKTGVPTRETWRLVPQPIAIRDMHEASAPSITMKDMLVHAGAEEGNLENVRAKVKAHRGFRWRTEIKADILESGLVFAEDA